MVPLWHHCENNLLELLFLSVCSLLVLNYVMPYQQLGYKTATEKVNKRHGTPDCKSMGRALP